jgi:hypothetical protein
MTATVASLAGGFSTMTKVADAEARLPPVDAFATNPSGRHPTPGNGEISQRTINARSPPGAWHLHVTSPVPGKRTRTPVAMPPVITSFAGMVDARVAPGFRPCRHATARQRAQCAN